MRKIVAVAVVAAVAFFCASGAAAGGKGMKIGYVKILEVLESYGGYADAKGRLEKAMQAKKKELMELEKELMELQKEYEKKKSILSAKAREEKEYILRKKLEDYQNIQLQANRELAAKEQQMTAVLLDELKEHIAKVAEDEGFDLVLDETAVLYQKGKGIDLTAKVVEYVKKRGVRVIVRGLRAVTDFEMEFQMALVNKQLDHGVETVFLVTSTEHSFISSSIIKEVASFGGDVSSLVAPIVAEGLKKKYSGG